MAQKRSKCDACPARQRLHRVKVGARKLDLCSECIAALRRIEQERLTQSAKA